MVRYRVRCLVLLCCILLAAKWPGRVTGEPALPSNAPRAMPSVQTPATQKPPNMASVLHELAQLGAEGEWTAATALARQRDLVLQDGEVQVVLEGEADTATHVLLAARTMGLTVQATYRNLVQALVPVASLPEVASLPAVKRVRLPYRPEPLAVISQGVALTGANVWHAAGYIGQGVKVAVIDLGFQDYASRIPTEELPANLIARSFRDDGDIQAATVHGTACAEILYDMAPGAQIYLLNFGTDVEFGSAVDYALAQGVQVISCSLGWLGVGPYDGSGPICNIVNEARQRGVFWAQSAGNAANKHWEGPWSDPDYNDRHDFVVRDETQSFSVAANTTIKAYLNWDDPWGASDNDYDLYLLNGDGYEVARSDGEQNGDDNPTESIRYQVGASGGTYHLQIRRFRASGVARFELYTFDQPLEYQVAASSLLIPADAAGAVATGAVHWQTQALESYSSRGPTNDGRFKPEFSGPDGVSTVSYPAGFIGTSAAAPHLAGAAALVRGAYPGYNVADVVSVLTQRAVDLGPAGPDYGYGHGRLALGFEPGHATPTPTPTATPIATPTRTRSPTASPTSLHTPTRTGSPTASPTSLHTPTPTRTLVPGSGGAVAGHVFLQGRVRHGGTLVNVDHRLTTTDASGTFWVEAVSPGMHNVGATMPGYLYAMQTDVAVVADRVTVLPPVTLSGGDANGDCMVGLFDLVLVAIHYDSIPPSDPRADINGNGEVDIFDLVLVCKNLDRTCPQPWELAPAARAEAKTLPEVRVSPSRSTLRKGDWVTLTVALEGVQNLYGADIRLSFDPTLLEAVDADPSRPGIQVSGGDLLDARQTRVVQDGVDNDSGTVRYALSLTRPALGVNGSGVLYTLAFRARGYGAAPLTLMRATLVSGDVQLIPATLANGWVSVLPDQYLYLPITVKH